MLDEAASFPQYHCHLTTQPLKPLQKQPVENINNRRCYGTLNHECRGLKMLRHEMCPVVVSLDPGKTRHFSASSCQRKQKEEPCLTHTLSLGIILHFAFCSSQIELKPAEVGSLLMFGGGGGAWMLYALILFEPGGPWQLQTHNLVSITRLLGA